MARAGKEILMKITPAILVDIILIAVIVITTLHYRRKGFVAGLLDLIASLLSLALAWIVSGRLSPTVFENFFKSGLIDQMAAIIQRQGGVNLSALLSGLSGFLPQRLLDEIAASAAGLLDPAAPNLAQRVVEDVIAPLVIPLISTVVFFATFLLCRILAALLVTALTNLNKIPVLGGVNRTLGTLVGVVVGLIYMLLGLCLLWAIVVFTNGTLPALNDNALSGSILYSLFAAYNPFL